MAGPQTVFGDAIGLALSVFERAEGVQERVRIVLTDGNDTNNKVPPARAAEIARDRQVTIYTVAVGDPPAAGEEKLDEETLKTVATTTGGITTPTTTLHWPISIPTGRRRCDGAGSGPG
jgi:Ca-activated chloride channel family protein